MDSSGSFTDDTRWLRASDRSSVPFLGRRDQQLIEQDLTPSIVAACVQANATAAAQSLSVFT